MSSPSSNVVTINDLSGTVTSMSYVDGSACVTSGQDNKPPPTITQSGRVFTITFLANRKNSSDVATSFNNICGGAAYEWAGSGGGGRPGSLNFYFGVQINFSTAQGTGSTTVYLGQGHYSLTNNWWIGGSAIISSVPCVRVAVGSAGDVLTLPLSGGVSNFVFSPGSVQ